MNLKAHNGNTS